MCKITCSSEGCCNTFGKYLENFAIYILSYIMLLINIYMFACHTIIMNATQNGYDDDDGNDGDAIWKSNKYYGIFGGFVFFVIFLIGIVMPIVNSCQGRAKKAHGELFLINSIIMILLIAPVTMLVYKDKITEIRDYTVFFWILFAMEIAMVANITGKIVIYRNIATQDATRRQFMNGCLIFDDILYWCIYFFSICVPFAFATNFAQVIIHFGCIIAYEWVSMGLLNYYVFVIYKISNIIHGKYNITYKKYNQCVMNSYMINKYVFCVIAIICDILMGYVEIEYYTKIEVYNFFIMIIVCCVLFLTTISHIIACIIVKHKKHITNTLRGDRKSSTIIESV